jgi:Fur family transcriptional regulator, ferric uptake regulator
MHNDNFVTILKKNNVSVTTVRRAIFDALSHTDRPLKNGEVAALVPSVDRASVYRTLELFDRLGLTTTIIRGWTPFTELAEPFKPHHHHIVCEQCGVAVEIENDTLEDVLGLIAKRHDFSLTKHIVELTGTCAACQAKS